MCTAITLLTQNHYFGRNLDLEYSYDETITITPQNYPLPFRKKETMRTHYALIGMAYVCNDYPLYYDATNEKGLSMAGLNFPKDADYKAIATAKDNIAPFEFIPWILGQCASLSDARNLLKRINLIHEDFSADLPVSPLHWIISDKTGSLVVESINEGLMVYENQIGILTNHRWGQTPNNSDNFNNRDKAARLPGDWSSKSRFVKASFLRKNASSDSDEASSVSQFFHILNSVAHPRGCVITEKDKYVITIYSSCCNTNQGIYYYTTYENSQITAIDMRKENLAASTLISYPLIQKQQIKWQN